MLTAKDILEMEESLSHDAEPRRRSDTFPDGEMSSGPSSDWNPALASRRASVPMEIIIGENGKPIFNTASSSSTTGSPVVSERRRHRHISESTSSSTRKGGAEPGRNGSKKQQQRSSSVVKKKVLPSSDASNGGSVNANRNMKKNKENGAGAGAASNNNKGGRKKEKEPSPEVLHVSQSMATCSIGPVRPSKNIEHLPPAYEFLRPDVTVTVRDAIIQTDLF